MTASLVDGDIIRIQRLTGEAIASIPRDANSQPIGIALTLDDVENFHLPNTKDIGSAPAIAE